MSMVMKLMNDMLFFNELMLIILMFILFLDGLEFHLIFVGEFEKGEVMERVSFVMVYSFYMGILL